MRSRLALRPYGRFVSGLIVFWILILLFSFNKSHTTLSRSSSNPYVSFLASKSTASSWNSTLRFSPLKINGYISPRVSGTTRSCEAIQSHGQLDVQKSFSLSDDIEPSLAALERHPMIQYSDEAKVLSPKERIARHWFEYAQSAVWVDSLSVYFSVSRLQFEPSQIFSFIRCQAWDKDWNELKNYTVDWQGQRTVYPRTLDIAAPYKVGGVWYGTEDARIVIEQGVQNAEPIVTFNMISNVESGQRTIHLHRPFSNATQLLTIAGTTPRKVEKNWVPFFYSPTDSVAESKQWPNPYLHFVYSHSPLEILKCHMYNGLCDFAFKQQLPEDFQEPHHQPKNASDLVNIAAGKQYPDHWFETSHEGVQGKSQSAWLGGGTNYVPMTSTSPNTSTFVGFPRTHVAPGCSNAFYRPHLAVLTATTPSQWHLSYVSGPLDFGELAGSFAAKSDVCGHGRILIANSVSRWEEASDVMTINFSLNDATTQVVRLRGVRRYLESLRTAAPSSRAGQRQTPLLLSAAARDQELVDASMGESAVACAVEAAVQLNLDRHWIGAEILVDEDARRKWEKVAESEARQLAGA